MAKLWGKRSKKPFFGTSKQQQNSDDLSSSSSSTDSSGKQQPIGKKSPDTKKDKRKGRAPSKATASLPKAVAREYTPPLKTIDEHFEVHNNEVHLVTPGTEVASPNILQSVSVVDDTADESVEAVVGSSSTKSEGHAAKEPSVLFDKIHVFGNTAESMEVVVATDEMTSHDDIRKKLFPEEEKEEEEEEEEGKIVENKVKVDEASVKVNEVKVEAFENKATGPITPEETPFDQAAEYRGDEDPAILDLIQASASASVSTNSIMAAPDTKDFKSSVRDALITKKLFELMQCNFDTTEDRKSKCGMDMFYDTVCASGKGSRPFFNKEFTRDFLEDASKDGIPLMYHFEVETDDSPGAPLEWKGHSVTMFLRQGSYQGSKIVHPRLEWPTPEQQLWTTEQPDTVNLMDIQSISDSSQDEVRDDIEAVGLETMDLCFFSITTKDGDVHMFESSSPAERDWIVTGLKNVIVRLSYHLTVGDPAVSSELFSAEYEDMSGELPTLKTPVQAMNEAAHAFLD